MTIDTSKIPVPSNDFTVVSCPTGKTAQNWSATKAQILSNITNYIWCRISWYDGDTPFITGKTNANNDILLTSATDISASQVWGCLIPGVWVSAQSSVDGKANTLAIVNHSCSNSNTAAELCYNKWTWNIWYLPASSELNLFYTNLKQAWLWTFAAYYYWTSTEYSSDISASQNFVDGAIHSGLMAKPILFLFVARADCNSTILSPNLLSLIFLPMRPTPNTFIQKLTQNQNNTLIKKLRNNKKLWFTLVELIVVITILVILWTIAFTSLSGFSWGARDSSRVSDPH